MSELPESLLEERLSQLQQISERRRELLQEMYNLIQQRENLGASLAVEGGDNESLHDFLERFDLEKHPETGYMSNLSDDEFVKLSLPEPTEQSGMDEESSLSGLPHTDQESPMSDSSALLTRPLSPGVQLDDSGSLAVQEDVAHEPAKAVASTDADVGSDDIEVVESPSYRGTKRKRSVQHSDDSDGEHDDVELVRSPPSQKPRSSPPEVQPASGPEPSLPRTPSPEPIEIFSDQEEEDEEMNLIMESGNFASTPPVEESTNQFASEDTVDRLLQPQLSTPSVQISERRQRREYVIPAPIPSSPPTFNFDDTETMYEGMDVESKSTSPANTPHHKFDYTLPPLRMLPAEFNRKGKPARHQRKRGKEKEKNDKGVDKSDGKKEDWVPMGINRWSAVVRANPVWKRLSKTSKCLSTRDWNIGMTEVRLVRTLDRIEQLKESGHWSFRQPKKQKGPASTKTHWDFLMGEMKWLRIDFREERRWKVALAFNLAHAVMDWHEADSLEERVSRGICVLWKRPPPEDQEALEDDRGDDVELPDIDEYRGMDSGETNTPANDDEGSEDESEDEQEKEQQDVFDCLAPGLMLEDALQDAAEAERREQDAEQIKSEYVEERLPDFNTVGPSSSVATRVGDTMDVDGGDRSKPGIAENASLADQESHSGLKSTSKDPTLVATAPEGIQHVPPTPSKKHKAALYGPLRQQILHSDADKLFLDLDDFELVKNMSSLSTEDHSHGSIPDLQSIFPELAPLGIFAPNPADAAVPEGRKKSDKRSDKDDPHKRVDEISYGKVAVVTELMRVKPTLLGALEPSRHWVDDHWEGIDELPIVADSERPSTRMINESLCNLFDNLRTNSPSTHPINLPINPRRRAVEHVWIPQEDTLLKQLVERYPNNWNLIADAFNSSRVTIATDRRSALDCVQRWQRLNAEGRSGDGSPHAPEEGSHAQVPPTPNQMITRGYKRSASNVVAATPTTSGPAALTEPKKRRRHNLMYEAIRKATKKREAIQKQNAAQRKPAAVHETHGQFSKMSKYTPIELSRLKAEKEARDSQEAMMKRRNDEFARQQVLRAQQAGTSSQLPQQQPAQQQAQPQQPQPPQQSQQTQQANGVGRAPVANGLPQQAQVPQIRTQVGISQQQRLSTPMALANQQRLTQSQVMQQAQQQAAQARVLAQVQQAQAQAQAHQAQAAASSALNAAASVIVGATHLSPPYAARATSGSPAVPQHSPRLPSATPVPAHSPRPPSAQSQPHGSPPQGVAGVASALNGVARAPQGMGYYHQMQGRHGATLTPEQMEQAMHILRQQQQRNAASHQQNGQHGAYPPQT